MDDETYIAVSEAHMHTFFRMAYSILRNRHDAEDAVQQALLNAWKSRDRARAGTERAWMTRIVVNGALKSLRGSGRISYVEELPDCEEEDLESLPQVPPAILADMIKALPDGYRTVFNLFVFEKKSHKEIAELLGIKENSSASQFFRARALLARQIKDYLKHYEL